MSYTMKPSIGMLPIEDIIAVLKKDGKIVTNESIEYVTRVPQGTYTATPGIQNPGMIAVCAGSKNSNGTLDRGTVNNAIKLNGKAASEYLTTADRTAMDNTKKSENKVQSNEIQLLRDELYGLKAELIRGGIITDTFVADGYIDGFKKRNVKYNTGETVLQTTSGTSVRQVNNIFTKDDWFAAQTDVSKEFYRTGKVTASEGSNIDLSISTAGIQNGKAKLYKTLGEYNKGTFSFSKVKDKSVGSDKYVMLTDDTNVVKHTINTENNGVAALIRVPDRSKGVLSSVKVFGQAIGNPGALTCYILNADKFDDEFNGAVVELTDSDAVIGKSTPIRASECKNGEIVMPFSIESGNAIELENKNYMFLIVGENLGFTNDCWKIELGARKASSSSADLQTNNKSYSFAGDTFTTLNTGDMLHIITIKELVENQEVAYNAGIYTTAAPVKMSSPITANRARVTLEVSKEGNIRTDNASEIKRSIKVSNNNSMFREGDTVIIGTSIRKVAAVEGEDIITLDKPLYVENNSPIYKCAYEVKVKTYKTTENGGVQIIDSSTVKNTDLKLVSVIPSGREDSIISDRLIFESESEITNFNNAELQIKWNSTYAGPLTDTYIGRIHGLSMAFDRTV